MMGTRKIVVHLWVRQIVVYIKTHQGGARETGTDHSNAE